MGTTSLFVRCISIAMVITIQNTAPAHGGWTSFQPRGSCTQTCGGGTRTFVRTCLSKPCRGKSTITTPCNKSPCSSVPVIGVWTAWKLFGHCSKTCGVGVQTYRRTCQGNPAFCKGTSTMKVECNKGHCLTVLANPYTGKYGPWWEVGSCSRAATGECSIPNTCCNEILNGVRTSIRRCTGPGPCDPKVSTTKTVGCKLECEQPTCMPACQNGGRCVAQNTCDCAGTGFQGVNCGYQVMNGCLNLDGRDMEISQMVGYSRFKWKYCDCGVHSGPKYSVTLREEPSYTLTAWRFIPHGDKCAIYSPGLGQYAFRCRGCLRRNKLNRDRNLRDTVPLGPKLFLWTVEKHGESYAFKSPWTGNYIARMRNWDIVRHQDSLAIHANRPDHGALWRVTPKN